MIRYHSAEEVAAERARHPSFWIVELCTPNATCLAAIEPTPENANRLVPFVGDIGFTGDMLDEACIRVPRPA